ncbi:hypothetical protein [Olleya namhaensis]|uniref:hypothetical protein n=1 Tax=Olleya namhaensis TaxID=1144750 RepID=UPI002493019F|nr:hypothetical protein [Olleya namhaensis]
METIYILNIPNFYTSYYLFGLNQSYKLKFKMDNRFIRYNNKPVLIFEIQNKIVIIDNDDPINVRQELYDICTTYFVTNKLFDNKSFGQDKVKPLFPHYPINIVKLYLGLYNFKLLKYIGFKPTLKQLYTLIRRPNYKNYSYQKHVSNFVFFSSNIWKKESEANFIRAQFIRFCKADSRIVFEGGFVPRSDGNNQGFDNELNARKYNPKTFSKLSANSKIVLNNSAVCGAVSWRLAEYLNQGLFVLSFPFKIDLPIKLENNQNLCFVNNTDEFPDVFDRVFNDSKYHADISEGGKRYFSEYCTPKAQINYIIKNI